MYSQINEMELFLLKIHSATVVRSKRWRGGLFGPLLIVQLFKTYETHDDSNIVISILVYVVLYRQ